MVSTATGPQPESPASGASSGPAAPADPAAAVAPAAPGRGRGRGTWLDLVRTLLVVLAFVALIVLLVPRPGTLPRPGVDVPAAVEGARTQLGFTPAEPGGLPQGWQPTAVETRRGTDGIATFHISYITTDGLYAGVDQAASSTKGWIDANNGGGERLADVTLDGVTWQQFARPDRQYTSLLLERPDRVYLVTTKQGGLEAASTLARALRLPPG